MSHEPIIDIVTAACSLVVVPWCIWVTVSLFNQRQELALLKQIIHLLAKKK